MQLSIITNEQAISLLVVVLATTTTITTARIGSSTTTIRQLSSSLDHCSNHKGYGPAPCIDLQTNEFTAIFHHECVTAVKDGTTPWKCDAYNPVWGQLHISDQGKCIDVMKQTAGCEDVQEMAVHPTGFTKLSSTTNKVEGFTHCTTGFCQPTPVACFNAFNDCFTQYQQSAEDDTAASDDSGSSSSSSSSKYPYHATLTEGSMSEATLEQYWVFTTLPFSHTGPTGADVCTLSACSKCLHDNPHCVRHGGVHRVLFRAEYPDYDDYY